MNKSPNQIREAIEEVTKNGKYEIKRISILVADYDGYDFDETNWEVSVELELDKWNDRNVSIEVSEHGEDREQAILKARRLCKTQLAEYNMEYEVAR